MDNNAYQPQRLQKVIARLGLASRREAEELISQGLVKVNGQVVKEQGRKVFPDDIIEIRNKKFTVQEQEHVYYLLHKPEGVITSVKDPRNRKTVLDLLKVKERVYPVGRLDYNTSGLLLLTNDGDLTYRLTHPSYEVDKTYRVWVKGPISKEALKSLERGVKLEDCFTHPAKIGKIRTGNEGDNLTSVEITIHEGRNRQVRRMFEKVGYPVVRLQRIAFASLTLEESLKPGEYRPLKDFEIARLKKETGLK